MLYDEKFIIHREERISDGMGGYTPNEVEIGSLKASTIPLSMEFQLSESNRSIKEIRRLITEDKLPFDFSESEDTFTLEEEKTEDHYTITGVISLGKETALLIKRDK